MKKGLFLIPLLIVLATGLLFGGCGAPAPSPAPTPTPSSAPAPAPSQLPPIKIGVLFPTTGPVSFAGVLMVEGAKFAFEQAGNEVAGRKIEVIVDDSGGVPEMALDKARKQVEHDQVSMIIGPMQGGEEMAVASYMTKMGVPLIVSNPCNWQVTKMEWGFMSGGSEPQQTSPMGRYAYDDMGLKTITVVHPDYAPGYGYLNPFMDTFKARGGEVVQVQKSPWPCQDYAPFLASLKDADAVVAWMPGADAMTFLNQLHEFGIRQRMPLVAAYHGNFVSPTILGKLRPEAAEATIGELAPTLYTPLLETDVNKRFVKAFRDKYGRTPGEEQEGAYVGGLVALKALEATGGDTTPEKLRQAILNLKFEAPEGPVRFDQKTGCAIKDLHIIRIDKRDGEYVWVPIHTYEAVPPEGY